MTTVLIIVCWLSLSILTLTLVWPFLKSAKVADEMAEEFWENIDHFDKRI